MDKAKIDEKSLQHLENLFNAFSIIASEAYVYICDMKYDVSIWSKSAVDYFGLESELIEKAGNIWENHIHPMDREYYHNSIKAVFDGKSKKHDLQYRAKVADGSYTICTCRGTVIDDENGVPRYFAGTIRNHGSVSYIDNNTGLRNLYGFFEDLKPLIWNRQKCEILMLGIKHFSNINDVYGYNFGNTILCKFGGRILHAFSGNGYVYKLDGTKFAVISLTLPKEEIEKRYDELQSEVAGSFIVNEKNITLSLSAGLLEVDNFNTSEKIIYSCLKYAYYESKNNKFGDLCLFSEHLNGYSSNTAEMLNDIRNSILSDCKGFFLCYQPIVDSETEKINGMEALIRWKSDKYGVVPPIQFIPVLEHDTIFIKLGQWILRQAMVDGKKMLKYIPDLLMNVNLSYTQIVKNGFIDSVFEIVDEVGFPPENLCLELTERCRLVDTGFLHDTIGELSKKGIKTAIDDFGTGYSSMGVLRSVKSDIIKIDRDYVKNIEISGIDGSTVGACSDIAGKFGARLCVEGVETPSMRDLLRKYNVDEFQGYYYSKPLPADEILDYIKNSISITE